MCGILGWCNYKYELNLSNLKTVSNYIISRGPDAYGEYKNKYLSLIHTRLSIIDLNERSNQPFKDKNNGNVISFNGEIYNFKLLRKELQDFHDIKFNTSSDTEVVLKGYSVLGIEKLLKKLDGMFAFSIWDNNNKSLILARDKFGEKPLYYTNDNNNGLIFSSYVSPLTNLSKISNNRQINKESLFNYFNLGYLIGNKTFIKDVKQLEPACYLIFNKNISLKNIEIKKYWKLEDLVLQKKKKIKLEEATKIFDELFLKSINKRMISDIDPGSFLSGGIDSSLVSLNMAKISNNSFLSHNLKFLEKNFDESHYANKISQKYNIQLLSHSMPHAKQVALDFRKIVSAMDQPLADTAFIANYYLSKASTLKSKVVLSGDGGDELFGGYETYTADNLKKIINIFPKFLTSFIYRNFISKLKSSYKKKISVTYKLKKFFHHLNLNEEHAHILWRAIFNSSEIYKFSIDEIENYNFNFFEKLDKEYKLVKNANLIDKSIFLDLKTWFPNNILTKIDRSSMFHSQEARLPFLDPEIIDFSFSLNPNLKFNFLNKKIILKNSLQKKMGKKFVNRKKEGFNTPIGQWIAEDKNFKELTISLLETNFIKSLIKKEFINDLLKKHINGLEDNSFKIFNLIVLSQWIEDKKLYL